MTVLTVKHHFDDMKAFVIAICLIGANSALAEPALVLGMGTGSCERWLSSPLNRTEGGVWALGYWSARNRQNAENHTVGDGVDTEGILGEVRKVCRDNPSMNLYSAVGIAYDALAGR